MAIVKEVLMLTVDVRSRVEPQLKREAAAVLKAAGLDVSTAIRLFLLSVVEKGGLPMDLPRANPVTLAAIRDAKTGKTTRTTLEDF
jgi:DNA-damage-inducible protein J